MPTLTDVLANDDLRRSLFPVVTERIYLAHAGVGPLSGPARDALIHHAQAAATDNQEALPQWQALLNLRRVSAQLMGCLASEISLLGPTALGLNTVALGIDWRAGDEIVCHAHDYPSNVYPWADLERRGVKLVRLEPELPGVITPDMVAAAMSERTRMVALASCHFLSGYRIDIDAIGQIAHDHDALFCLDAIQTLGAFPTPLAHVDFAAADGHKWLLGPCAAGLFYCDRQRVDELRPALLGSFNVVSPDFVTQPQIDFETGGRRFEPGTLNFTGGIPLAASIELLNELGINAISERLLVQREQLRHGLQAQGWHPIHGSLEDDHKAHHWRSGVLTVRHPDRDMDSEFKRLEAAQITASLRRGPDGQQWLRLAPHAYISDQEIATVIEIMSAM